MSIDISIFSPFFKFIVSIFSTDKQTPEQLKDPNKIRPPEWRGGVYDLKLEKRDSGWIIVSVVRTGDVPEAADAASTAQEGAAA